MSVAVNYLISTDPLLEDIPKAHVALQVLQQINVSGSLCIEYGSEQSMDGEVHVHNIVKLLCEKVKSSKLEAKVCFVQHYGFVQPVCTTQYNGLNVIFVVNFHTWRTHSSNHGKID